ncbi:hypothetical protein IX83_00435 [Basilea psittacipulmonis DSM 24701]|uniref:Uncharacterized protein n=1 Tax=Basilea psittacipulmonis DSM 24701 TaxID=1072685 RepID=A0A077DEY7_9BURK|nr:hypothetical protein IX83_00435 [Basilea psittacipulmonis DSM 24701]
MVNSENLKKEEYFIINECVKGFVLIVGSKKRATTQVNVRIKRGGDTSVDLRNHMVKKIRSFSVLLRK